MPAHLATTGVELYVENDRGGCFEAHRSAAVYFGLQRVLQRLLMKTNGATQQMADVCE